MYAPAAADPIARALVAVSIRRRVRTIRSDLIRSDPGHSSRIRAMVSIVKRAVCLFMVCRRPPQPPRRVRWNASGLVAAAQSNCNSRRCLARRQSVIRSDQRRRRRGSIAIATALRSSKFEAACANGKRATASDTKGTNKSAPLCRRRPPEAHFSRIQLWSPADR